MSIPLSIGSDHEFALVREFLIASGFQDEDAITRAVGVTDLYQYALGSLRPEMPDHPADLFDLCLRLFLEGRVLPLAVIRDLAGESVAGALQSLGLLENSAEDESRCFCPVSLYPVRDLFIASDRWTNPDGSNRKAADDMVYAALVRNTNSFLNLILEEPCEKFLDLCSGTGVAAFYAARDFARTAYAFDLTDRCRVFSGFNARLNGLSNVVIGQGDLYEPAGDQQFDRIVAHPPYVPVLRHKWIYHSGGQDGEQITRRIIEGLPKYLAPGGTFICLAAATDRKSGAFEDRVRGWLGDASDEFDVTLVVRNQMEPAVFVMRQILFGFAGSDDLREWKQVFSQLAVTDVIYGPIVIHRRASGRKVFTARRKASVRSTPLELFWVQQWESIVAEGNLASRLLDSTLRTVPGSRLTIEHELDGKDDWDARRYLITSSYPFAMQCENNAFLALLTAKLQQPTTAGEVLQQLKREGVLHPSTDPEEFCEAVATLISGGFVETSICPLPQSDSTAAIGGLEDAD